MLRMLANGRLISGFDRYGIVEEEHSLWDGVSRAYRETIRAFLVYFQNEVCSFTKLFSTFFLGSVCAFSFT